ncbi:MAG TPA: CoA pyrophosphatase [Solirubrobacteraceae bacterium]|nr:CoA pyrophosphatase [Solirubrobacteraceae bacterium]
MSSAPASRSEKLPRSDSDVGLASALREVLLDAASHSQPRADEQVPAAVLVALYESGDGELRVVLTKRRADLRRHAGEISFPGGRRDREDATLMDTALREAEEEIGLARSEVTVVGALERTSTFVTNYAIHPFVGLLKGPHPWRASELEVDVVLEPTLRDVRAGKTRTQIERRGFTFETDAYVFDGQLVWGATARILEDLLARVEPLLSRHRVQERDLPAES